MNVARNVKPMQTLVPQVNTTVGATNGDAVDTMGFENLMALIVAGALDLVGLDETYTIKLQESIDAAFTAPVDIVGATTPVVAANTIKTIKLLGLGTGSRLRYVRAVLTNAGATVSIAIAVSLLLGQAHYNPANVPSA